MSSDWPKEDVLLNLCVYFYQLEFTWFCSLLIRSTLLQIYCFELFGLTFTVLSGLGLSKSHPYNSYCHIFSMSTLYTRDISLKKMWIRNSDTLFVNDCAVLECEQPLSLLSIFYFILFFKFREVWGRLIKPIDTQIGEEVGAILIQTWAWFALHVWEIFTIRKKEKTEHLFKEMPL